MDKLRLIANKELVNKDKFAQFMTPSIVAEYMADLFDMDNGEGKSFLDCGAGIGSLTVPVIKRKSNLSQIDCWEIDPVMVKFLTLNMKEYNANIHCSDFIQDSIELIKQGIRYDYIITNPPYKKISTNSKERKSLRSVGIETVNLYSAFLSLSIFLLKHNGQLVAIVPRSFCNGVYYKKFRELILKHCSIDYIHSFDSRKSIFSDDNVLQENIIIKLTKRKQQESVVIFYSYDDDFSKIKKHEVSFSEIVIKNDKNQFIRIPKMESIPNAEYPFNNDINNLELSVSTGQIVDFRVKEFLQENLSKNSYPLIYPHHFNNGNFTYPKHHKKPNAILNDEKIRKWLLPTNGCYIVVNRFSPKENKKRIIANIISPKMIDKDFIAIENHLNFFHLNKKGIDETIAKGLLCYLNSSVLDNYLRNFSGHTQINVGDLKSIPYPTKNELLFLGSKYKARIEQIEIDSLINEVIFYGKTTSKNK